MTRIKAEHIEGFLLGLEHSARICDKRCKGKMSHDAAAIRREKISLTMFWDHGFDRRIPPSNDMYAGAVQ